MFGRTAVLPWKGILVSLLCIGFLMFSTAPEAEAQPLAGGIGTEASPYQITDVVQLQAIQTVGNGVYLDRHFILMNTIVAADTERWNSVSGNVYAGFDPIGDPPDGDFGGPFTGHFDGQGHTITDLHIDRPGEDLVGLFGFVGTGGTITNIGVVGGSITG